jgi:hypothetical protein
MKKQKMETNNQTENTDQQGAGDQQQTEGTAGTTTDVGKQSPNPGAETGTEQANETTGEGGDNTEGTEIEKGAAYLTDPIYVDAKAKFAEGFQKWNTLTEEQKSEPDGVELSNQLTAQHKIIDGTETSDTDANEEVPEQKDEEVSHPVFDYTGKVRLSGQEFDAVDADLATGLVKKSGVNEHYKNNLLRQIEDDKITPEYAAMLRMIISADSKGQVYSGTLEG